MSRRRQQPSVRPAEQAIRSRKPTIRAVEGGVEHRPHVAPPDRERPWSDPEPDELSKLRDEVRRLNALVSRNGSTSLAPPVPAAPPPVRKPHKIVATPPSGLKNAELRSKLALATGKLRTIEEAVMSFLLLIRTRVKDEEIRAAAKTVEQFLHGKDEDDA